MNEELLEYYSIAEYIEIGLEEILKLTDSYHEYNDEFDEELNTIFFNQKLTQIYGITGLVKTTLEHYKQSLERLEEKNMKG